jgi:thymidylate synthase (FAD)
MKVYLISEPRLDYREFDRFIADEGLPRNVAYHVEPASDAECLVELCARLCYMSYGKGRNSTYECLSNITTQKHFSVMEHANWTFIVTGVSRSLTHELVRHRHLSYSQLSQRYVDESTADFIMPPALREHAGSEAIANDSFALARQAYEYIVEKLTETVPEWRTKTEARKIVRQAARAVLPNAIETKIAVTGNARAWREFIVKRNSPHADPEIRALAETIYDILRAKAPSLFLYTMGDEE